MAIGIFLVAEYQKDYWMFTHPDTKEFPAQESMELALQELTGNSEVQQKFLEVLFNNQVDIRLTPIEMDDPDLFTSAILVDEDDSAMAFNIGQIEFLKLKPEIGQQWFDAGTRVSA